MRNELGLIKESEKNKSEDIKNVDSKIEEVFPETTSGQLKIEREKQVEENKERERQWEIGDKKKLFIIK